MTTPSQLARAIAHHRAGQLPEAERIHERILRTEPRHADALHLLGVVAHQSGDHARAVELISSAVDSGPASPFYLTISVKRDARSASTRRRPSATGAPSRSRRSTPRMPNPATCPTVAIAQ